MSESLPMWVKSAKASKFVEPLRESPSMLAPHIDAPIVDVAGAWDSKPTVQEIGTPVHRSVATLIRSAPVVVFLVVLGVPLAWWVNDGWDWVLGVAIMGGLGLIGTLGVLLLDLQYNSPSSTERHRIDKAAALKRQELKQTHELRRAVIEAWIERMEVE
jgi:hypothetical protein